MKKTLIAAILLVPALTLIAAASENVAGIADQVIVDRSTRSKVLNDYTLLTRDTIQRAWTTPTALNTPGALKGRISVNYIVTRSGALEGLGFAAAGMAGDRKAGSVGPRRMLRIPKWSRVSRMAVSWRGYLLKKGRASKGVKKNSTPRTRIQALVVQPATSNPTVASSIPNSMAVSVRRWRVSQATPTTPRMMNSALS